MRKKVETTITLPDVAIASINVSVQPLALNLQDAARVCGLTRWTIHESIMRGDLKAKWAGRNRIVFVAELQRWLNSLEDVEPSAAPSIAERRAVAA